MQCACHQLPAARRQHFVQIGVGPARVLIDSARCRAGLANAARVLTALSAFGFAGLDVTASDLSAADCIIQLGYPPGRIDILTSLSGVTFDEVWQHKVHGDFGGIEAIYIGRQDLLRNKKSTGRLKDAGDADELARRIRE